MEPAPPAPSISAAGSPVRAPAAAAEVVQALREGPRAAAARLARLCQGGKGGVLERLLDMVASDESDDDENPEEGAGACLMALARHHWSRLPASETGPARDQLLEVCLAAHERVRTPRGRLSVLSALRYVASSVDGELVWPGVVARLKQAFEASVKGWTSNKPVPAPLVDCVRAIYAVVRRYEFPNSEETIWDEAPDMLDDMVKKLVHPMVKRVLVAVMRDRGTGRARVPRAAWTEENEEPSESAAMVPAKDTASSKCNGSSIIEGKNAAAAAAADDSEFSYVPPHLRNNNNNKENDKAVAETEFHGVHPVDLARIVAKTFFRATRSYTPEGMEKIVAELIKVYPSSFMKEMLPNSLLSHGGSISPQAWRLHARMLKLLISVQKNDECLEMVSKYHARVLDLLCRSVRVSSFGGNNKKKNKKKGKGGGAAAAIQKNTLIPDKVLALCFDNIGIICDVSRPIWLSDMQPQLDSFLRKAVFPALALGSVDEQLWARDPDLYVRTNLDLEHVSSDAKEIRSARKSALDVIAVIGGIPPEETEPQQTKANGQRKKGGKNKGRKKKKKKEAQGPPSNCEKVLSLCDALMFEAAELASAVAGSGGGGDAEAVADAKREAEAARVRTQCAIVLAYGALCDAILEDSRKKRKSAGTAISDFVGEHIMPSLDPAGQLIMFPDWRIEQNPMLAANALWSLVRFAEHLPSPKVASTSLNCAALMLNHTDDQATGISWAPVRVAAAHAVQQLLEVHFEDEDAVKSHLPDLFPRVLSTVDDGSHTACGEVSFRVLHKLTEVSSESVAPYIEDVADRVIAGCAKTMEKSKATIMNSEMLTALGGVATALRSYFVKDEEEEEEEDSDDDEDSDDEEVEDDEEEEQANAVVADTNARLSKKHVTASDMSEVERRCVCENVATKMIPLLRRMLETDALATTTTAETSPLSSKATYHPDISLCVLFLTEFVESIEVCISNERKEAEAEKDLDDDEAEEEEDAAAPPTQPLSRALSDDIYTLASSFVLSMLPAIPELILLEEEWSVLVSIVRVASRHCEVNSHFQSAFPHAVRTAIALMERSTDINCSRAGLRMLVAMFNHQLEIGWMSMIGPAEGKEGASTVIESIVSATLTTLRYDGFEWDREGDESGSAEAVDDKAETKEQQPQEDEEDEEQEDEEELDEEYKENERKLMAALNADCSCVLLHCFLRSSETFMRALLVSEKESGDGGVVAVDKLLACLLRGIPAITSTMDRRALVLATPAVFDALLAAPGCKDSERNAQLKKILSLVITSMFAVKKEEEEEDEESEDEEDDDEELFEEKKGEEEDLTSKMSEMGLSESKKKKKKKKADDDDEDDGDEDDDEDDEDDDDDEVVESYDDEDEIDVFGSHAVVDEFVSWFKKSVVSLQSLGIVEPDVASATPAGEAKEEADSASILPRMIAAKLM